MQAFPNHSLSIWSCWNNLSISFFFFFFCCYFFFWHVSFVSSEKSSLLGQNMKRRSTPILTSNQKAELSENGNCKILSPKTSIQSDFWARTDEEGRSASNKFQLSIERQRWIIKTFRTKPHRIQLGKFRLGSEKICQSRPISHLFTSFKSKSRSLLAKLQIANPNRNEKCRPRPKRLKVQTVQFPLICKTKI